MIHMLDFKGRKLAVDTAHDLASLSNLLRLTSPAQELRHATPRLRNLLIHGLLQKTWRSMGFEKSPEILANILHVPQKSLPGFERPYKGVSVLAPPIDRSGLVIRHHELDQSPPPIELAFPTTEQKTLPLAKFLESSGLFMCGSYISRSSALKFVTNKRGGTHLDWDIASGDDPAFALLARLYDPQVVEAGRLRGIVIIKDTRSLTEPEQYVLSIVADLLHAPGIQQLRAKIENSFPDEFK